MEIYSRISAPSRVKALVAQPPVQAAMAWLRGHASTIMDWQTKMVAIPAPSLHEQARAEWLAVHFIKIGLDGVEIDKTGNVWGRLPLASPPPGSSGLVVLLSAHLDTVFPSETPLKPVVKGDRLEAPGACDNAAGVVGMLAIAQALVECKVDLPVSLIFVGNVGEEGEGDLRGVRSLYSQKALTDHIAAHIVLDGAGADKAITEALGSRRYRVTITGPGGHSFTDAGTPNPITALATALAQVAETPLPQRPRTTLNLGTIHGGTSVNSIPESAQASIDFRSVSAEQLLRLETALEYAVDDAVRYWNAQAESHAADSRGLLEYNIEKIGDRPAAHLPADSPLFETLYAVDHHLGLHTDLRLGSTDANIPLSLGIPALTMGAGGECGGAHTLAEWYSACDRETGLRRVLLLVLAMLEWASEQ